MSDFRAIFLALLACCLSGFASAETLQVDGANNTSRFEQAGKPTRGMTQARVTADYGQPSARRDAVGDPPITRWEYPGFVVFFEYDHVIHAVTKR